MAFSPQKKESRYSSVHSSIDDTHKHTGDLGDLDLENDSDTTLASTGFLQKKSDHQQRKRSLRSPKSQHILVWIRWSVVVVLQGLIVFLLLVQRGGKDEMEQKWTEDDTETGGDINGLYVPKSHKWTLLTPDVDRFVPNMTNDDNRMEIRANWDALMPLGSGTVSIPDYLEHPKLGLPIDDDPIRTGPVFEASWTHALHCLYYTVDSYHQMVISNGTKFGFKGERNDAHANHCFEYLRNQLLCMGDMTLEGSQSVLDATGNGQAHMCRNMDEAKEWIESRRVDDIQSIVGP